MDGEYSMPRIAFTILIVIISTNGKIIFLYINTHIIGRSSKDFDVIHSSNGFSFEVFFLRQNCMKKMNIFCTNFDIFWR